MSSRVEAQSQVTADLLVAMMGIVQKQQEVSDVQEVRLKLESERIATDWATKPPPVTSAAELYNFTRSVLQYGAEHAIQVMQASAAHRDLLAATAEHHNPYHPNGRPLLDYYGRQINVETFVHGRCKGFCSFTSLSGRPPSIFSMTNRPYTVPMTVENMYHCLKVDEMRYKSEYMSCCALVLYSNGSGERQQNHSKYPL